MTTTRTLQNLSSETAESVNIKPFDRDGWVSVSRQKPGSNRQPLAYVEMRIAGADPEYPLVMIREVREANIYHPAGGASAISKGRHYEVAVHTTQKIEDSVSGLDIFVPVTTIVAIKHGGSTILNPADVLDQVLSTVAELYDSVSSGDVDTAAISRLALGDIEF